MNQISEKISFRKTRDIGEIFSVSFKFIRQNFKAFYGSLLFFAGPFLVAGTMAYTYFAGTAGFYSLSYGQNISNNIANLAMAVLTGMTMIMVGFSIYCVTLNKALIDNENLEPGESLTVAGIGKNFFGHYWRMLGNMFIFLLVIAVTLVVFFMLVVGLIALLKAVSGSDILSVIFTVLLFLVIFFILMPVISFIPVASVFVCQRNNINIFSAMGRVLYYMKNNFWNTWVFSLLALLTYMVMALIVQLPALIMTMAAAFSRMSTYTGQGTGEGSTPMALIIVTAICTIAGYMVMAVFYLLNIYFFTSLEEKKEGSKLIENINQIA